MEKNPLASSASALYTGFTEQGTHGILGMDVFGTEGGSGEVCAEEEVKLVHLLPLQGDHCRGFPPAVNFCFRNFFSNQEAGGGGAQLYDY